ncbi:uncharacterized protein LOC127868857 isoform X2 [Dreissena polymorpha]|uniref:uncharacterized protein LOC127868857 isoform X2 n=1 Tax=Dreissena polymorpha TaxID=45954 RepID=UPI0022646123|nr:uncharacterized protein LOC127868857 isoform X2 [Dreissena polymorpha]
MEEKYKLRVLRKVSLLDDKKLKKSSLLLPVLSLNKVIRMRCLFVLCVIGLAMSVSAKATGDASKAPAGDAPAVEAPAVDSGKGTAAPTDAAEAKSANGNAYAYGKNKKPKCKGLCPESTLQICVNVDAADTAKVSALMSLMNGDAAVEAAITAAAADETKADKTASGSSKSASEESGSKSDTNDNN